MSNSNISVCSYNIFWKVMDPSDTDLKNDFTLAQLKQFKKNIISNIQNVHDYYNPSIYCFQEASNFQDFIHIFKDQFYLKYINVSGPEYMVTVINKNKFSFIDVMPGQFQKGRPFCIFLLKDNDTDENFLLINIHAGHIQYTYNSIFKPIQKSLDMLDLNNKNNIDISRIVMAGDFNRDINHEIKIDSQLVLNIGNKVFSFKYYDKPMENTCCSLVSTNYTINFDFVIDSFKQPIIRHELNKELWYSNPSSDHVMIMSILSPVKKYI